MRARLAAEGVFGLHLTIGALVLLAAGWLFGGIAEDVVTADAITTFDVQVAHWFHAHATLQLTRLMLFVTHLHDPAAMLAWCTLLGLFLAWKKQWYWLLALAVCVPGGMLLNVLMKYAFQRARPSFGDPILTLTTYSFPSGHAAGSTLFYGFAAAYLMSMVRPWYWRAAIGLSAALLIALVGLSRLYLGVHYLSDVLAAICEGAAWLALCITAVGTLHRHRTARNQLLNR